MNTKQLVPILIHASVGWVFCAATIGIGMATTSIKNTLIIHVIGAPVFFIAVSIAYFTKYRYGTPLFIAILFIAFVVTVDFFLVALVINRSLEMFTNLLGTWIPFVLIFASTYFTGIIIIARHRGNNNTSAVKQVKN
ncbi:MAG: hypothetical protein C0417_08810 [Chlorobiaceae bacterium]|nr:hypothetical protein [Chlorobiaceae bacterium]